MQEAPRKRILVCGPRDFPSFWYVNVVVINLCNEFFNEGYNFTIVQGEAQGVDSMAKRAAIAWGGSAFVESFPPDWKRKGRSAGFQRNIEMLDSVVDKTPVDLVVSIGYGKGTGHTLTEAAKREIEIRMKCRWWHGKSAR